MASKVLLHVIVFIILIVLSIGMGLTDKMLITQLIYPCRCMGGTCMHIECLSRDNVDLKRVFEYVSIINSNPVVNRRYKMLLRSKYLHIDVYGLQELEEITFADLLFEQIFITNAFKLEKIHSNAFGATRTSIKHLYITEANALQNSPPNHNIFDALSSMNNIETIVLSGVNFTEIPDYAFRPLLGHHFFLRNISISGNVERIGNFSFYELPFWMNNISLGNRINYISSHAFDMRLRSSYRLTIYLADNQLTADSFEKGVFLNSKRQLYVDLSRNKLSYMREEIFHPFLTTDIMNQINMSSNPLECDCRMKWLLNKKVNFHRQVLNAVCSDGKSLWAHSYEELMECKSSNPVFVKSK